MGRFRDWFFGTEMRMATLANPDDSLFEAFGATRTVSGETISIEGSMAIADVFAAVDLICEQVSQLPLKVFRDLSKAPSNPSTGVVEAADHRAWGMLHDMPNPFTPAHRFWSTVAAHELLWGNWFLEKLRGPDGLVNELRILQPALVEVDWNEVAGIKRFHVTRQDGTQDRNLTEDRVLHGFGLSKDGLIGLSRIRQAREAIGLTQARGRFEGEIYGQKPWLSGVIKHPRTMKDGGVKLGESWQAVYGSGSKRRMGIPVLEEGAEFQPINFPLADMQFVENAKLSKTQIAVLFKIPPALLGGSVGDSLTYATVESNKIQFATQAIAPVANNIAQFVSHDMSIFPFQSWYAEFVMEGMYRGDSAARAAYWSAMKNVIGLDPKYIAQRENIPPSAVKEPEPVVSPAGETGIIPGNGNGQSGDTAGSTIG